MGSFRCVLNLSSPAALILLLANCLAARTITAAGASFPYPLYTKWAQLYKQASGGIQINYQSIGSGGGIKQLTDGTIAFAASDKPMSNKELAKLKTLTLHFPTVLGAVVPIYQVPGVGNDLKFTPEALSGIFLGSVTKWDDRAIAEANPGVSLPDQPIVVAVRSDSSGTSFVFTDFLSKTSAEWRKRVGAGTAVNWPIGLRQKGNEGVAGLVRQTPYSIGYVELIFAISQKIGYGSVRNSAGNFIKATLESVTAAASGIAIADDFRVSITNAPGAAAYPISTFTWLLVPAKIDDSNRREAITGFLNWLLTSGQQSAPSLGYAPLPSSLAQREIQAIALIR